MWDKVKVEKEASVVIISNIKANVGRYKIQVSDKNYEKELPVELVSETIN